MKKWIVTGYFLTMVLGTVLAQDFTFPGLTGFKKTSDYPVFTPENLWDYINGAADTYLTYGFVDLHVAEYKKGKSVIKAEVYRHSSNTLSFGIYSTERSSSFRFKNIGAQGYSADGAINFFKGNFYVKIRTYSKNAKILQAEESLAIKIANALGGNSEMPALLSRFPEIGKKLNEEVYINESVLGHKFLNKAFKAVYELGTDNFSVFMIESNTPEETHDIVEKYLEASGMDASDAEAGKYMLKDGYNGTVFLSWKENMIVIISGLSADQSEVADRYSSEIIK